MEQNITTFKVIGISIRTSNDVGKAEKDIPELWNRFLRDNIADKIPNKIGNDIFCIYTDYVEDHTKPYTVILGFKVTDFFHVPEGMQGISVQAGQYSKFIAKGNLFQGIVVETWMKIWNTKINRAYTTDFEIYGEKSKDPLNAEVEIYIAIK